MRLLQAASDQAHFHLRLPKRDAGFQSRDASQMARGALPFIVRLRHGPVKLALLADQAVRQRLKAGGHHSDDGVRLSAEVHPLTDNPRIAAEAPLPQSVAKDDHLILALLLLFGQEAAAEQRRAFHDLKISIANLNAEDPFRLTSA